MKRFQRNENIVLREIADAYYLIDISDNYAQSNCCLYELNEIGAFIWKTLAHFDKENDVVRQLLGAIVEDVPYEAVSKDVAEYIDMLMQEGFLQEKMAE